MQTLELIKKEMPTLEALLRINVPPSADAHAIVQQELEFLRMQMDLKPDLALCEAMSVVLAVKSAIKKNLSLDPQAGLVYIKTRNVNTAKRGEQDKWIKVMEVMPTANGLISINRQCGRILDIERPEVQKDATGKVVGVSVKYLVPSIPTPRWQAVGFDQSDFLKWRRASHKENSRGKQDANAETLNYSNPNYTNFKGGIDPEFARAKCIRHALGKLGTNPNEQHIQRIQVEPIEVVASHADEAATGDEINYGNWEKSGDEINFEDIPNL